MNEFVKDPDAVLDYEWPWADWLDDGDSLVSHEAAVIQGDVVVDSSALQGTSVVVWLSGGTAGIDCQVRVRVTTANDRTDDRTAIVRVRQR